MKRIVPFLLILALISLYLPVFLAVPVKAADTDEDINFINVLDLATPNDSGSLNVTLQPGTTSVTFTLPYIVSWAYVDILIGYGGGSLTGVTCTTSPSSEASPVPLDFLVFNGYFRVFGSGPSWTWNSFTLHFTVNATSWIVFQSFDLSVTKMTRYSANGSMDIDYGSSGSASSSFNTSSGEGSFILYDESDYDNCRWYWYIRPDRWYYYDFLDLNLYFNSCTISSVSVVYGKTTVPYYSNNFDLTNPSSRSAGIVDLRIDLRHLDRTKYDVDEFVIVVSGSFMAATAFQVAILDGCFFMIVDSINPQYILLQQIKSAIESAASSLGATINTQTTLLQKAIDAAITSINGQIAVSAQDIIDALNSLMGSTGAGEQVKQEAQQQAGEIDSAVSGLGDLDKPASGSGGLTGDISEVISPDTVSGSTIVLSSVLNAPYISIVTTIALTLSLAAYVLFGKRGG